jgi:pimeloyl-ACP methyl ester carboxylesterase
VARSFASPEIEARFAAAYDEVLAAWPVPVTAIDLASQFGHTRVQACGPEDAPSVILLSGGGATSTVWFNAVEALSRNHRVYAVDTMGDVGRSRPGGRPIAEVGDLMAWLDSILDRLGLLGAAVVGHSYGGQLALNYSLHAPQRVRAVVLLDPTNCFAGFSRGYLLHAIPVILRPSGRRMRSLIRWETAGAELDPRWLTLLELGAGDFPKSRVIDHRPGRGELAASTVPTMVLLAELSRAHDVRRVAANAHASMPRAVIKTLAGVSHHAIPILGATEMTREVLTFVG